MEAERRGGTHPREERCGGENVDALTCYPGKLAASG